MNFKKWKWFTGLALCAVMAAAGPHSADRAEAAGYIEGVSVETSASYKIKIDAQAVAVYEEPSITAAETAKVFQGGVYDVQTCGDGWVKLAEEQGDGYLRLADGAILVETMQERVNEEAVLRENIVAYALQFVGNRYVAGGTDPHTGADCSGFTAYVFRQTAGICLSHSSRVQAGEGTAVQTPKPGDLIFYNRGGSIGHVAIYIGGGQIVHASTEKTGIKISKWDYKTPAKIVDVLS